MITRIRIEAQADSLEQAKREIDILMGHAKMAALLEGIASDLHETTDEHYGGFSEQERESEPVIYGRYKGRQVAKFGQNKVEEGGLKQFGFKVLDTEQQRVKWVDSTAAPTGVVTYSGSMTSTMFSSWTENANYPDVTDEHIVLRRVNPASREHTWQVVPEGPPRSIRVRSKQGDTGMTIEWHDDELVGDVAYRAAMELLGGEQTDGWTFQMGQAYAVLNPQCKADAYLADGLHLTLVRQNETLKYGELPGIIPFDTHNV